MDKKQKISSISTKTGDCGQTSLANGERVAKDSLVMEVVGTIDELSSWFGLVIANLETDLVTHQIFLNQIQQNLYQLSAVIVRAPRVAFQKKALTKLEQQADFLEKEMADIWHGKFLHPGGTKSAARLDVARTICRRCERLYFKYSQELSSSSQKPLSPLIAAYLNRLSDYLYLLRCYFNLYQNHSEKQLAPEE